MTAYYQALILVRSLTFGGLIGACIFALLFKTVPTLFAGLIDLRGAIMLGLILGGFVHRWVDSFVIRGLLFPVGRKFIYYGKVLELMFQERYGLIGEATAEKIKTRLDMDYFLGNRSPQESDLIEEAPLD